MVLALVMAICMLPTAAFAASIEEEALGEADIYNGGAKFSYLSMNGQVQSFLYTYYLYTGANGQTQEIPAYRVNPNLPGVPQTVAPGESIKYMANEKASDPKVMGIVANGYPTRGLSELKPENKEQAYYATKIALWCYLIPSWNKGQPQPDRCGTGAGEKYACRRKGHLCPRRHLGQDLRAQHDGHS